MLDKTSIISYSQANFPQSFDSLPDLKIYEFGICYEKYAVKVGTISTNKSARGVYAFTRSGHYVTFHEGLDPHGRLIDQLREIKFNCPFSSIFVADDDDAPHDLRAFVVYVLKMHDLDIRPLIPEAYFWNHFWSACQAVAKDTEGAKDAKVLPNETKSTTRASNWDTPEEAESPSKDSDSTLASSKTSTWSLPMRPHKNSERSFTPEHESETMLSRFSKFLDEKYQEFKACILAAITEKLREAKEAHEETSICIQKLEKKHNAEVERRREAEKFTKAEILKNKQMEKSLFDANIKLTEAKKRERDAKVATSMASERMDMAEKQIEEVENENNSILLTVQNAMRSNM